MWIRVRRNSGCALTNTSGFRPSRSTRLTTQTAEVHQGQRETATDTLKHHTADHQEHLGTANAEEHCKITRLTLHTNNRCEGRKETNPDSLHLPAPRTGTRRTGPARSQDDQKQPVGATLRLATAQRERGLNQRAHQESTKEPKQATDHPQYSPQQVDGLARTTRNGFGG